MPQLPFIKSVIPCVNPQVVGRVRPPPVAEHLLRLVSLQISSAKSGHGQSSLPRSLPAAGGGHPCGKVRAAHVAGLQPLRRRAEIRYQPLSPTLYHALCPAAGRAGGLRGGGAKEPPGTATIRAPVRVLVSGERLLVQMLGNPIPAAPALRSVTCRGRSWIPVAARTPRVSCGAQLESEAT